MAIFLDNITFAVLYFLHLKKLQKLHFGITTPDLFPGEPYSER
jgi:hypothetical protein